MSLAPRIDRIDRNFIINGAMDFWQRVAGNTTTVNTASSASGYTTDRFIYFSEGTTVKNYSIARTTSVPTYTQSGFQFQYARRWQCLTAITSPSASDYIYHTNYRMEGLDYQALHGGKTIGFGFWIRTNVAGNHAVFLTNGAYNRAYATSFNIATGELNTWVYKTVSVTTDTIGTWVFDNTNALEIGFSALGSTNRTAPVTNQWYTVSGVQLGWFNGAANLMSSVGNYVELTGLTLQLGDVPASNQFIRAGRSIAQELAFCQRYYEKNFDLDVVPQNGIAPGRLLITNLNTTATRDVHVNLMFKATKRVIPTIATYVSIGGASGATVDNMGTQGGVLFNNLAAGTANAVHWTADSEL